MASISQSDRRLRNSSLMEMKPLMLKDYLLDDLSSCSSSGFKSFPRRHCCTTVRFLLEIDLKTARRAQKTKGLLLNRSRSKAASSTISALQRASEVVINAVKQLQLPSVKSLSTKECLTRSFSRKIFKRSFWRKTDGENRKIGRWKMFREFLEEKDGPSDQNTYQSSVTATATNHRVSTGTSSNSNNNSWTESEFTSDIVQSSIGNSESSSENDAVESQKQLPEEKTISSKRLGATVGEDSMEVENSKEWSNETEQFSPVSVLDCPFEEEISSHFQRSLARVEGTKQKLKHKIRRFESLARLEPVDLEKRIALSELNQKTLESPHNSGPIPLHSTDDGTHHKADELFSLIKSTTPLQISISNAENLLLDFFREEIEERHENEHPKLGFKEYEKELLKVAEDWVSGQPKELFLGWEVKDGRGLYAREMEKNGKWKKLDEEKQQVVLELELEVFTGLVEELLLDVF